MSPSDRRALARSELAKLQAERDCWEALRSLLAGDYTDAVLRTIVIEAADVAARSVRQIDQHMADARAILD